MKNKSFSKVLIGFVIFAFIITAVSGINLMAETFEYDLSAAQDGSVMGTLDTGTGLFTIEGTGEMLNYSSSSDRQFNSYRNKIKTVTISDGITNIPANMFYDCQYITSISIPDSVTVIGDYAFYKNQRLTSLALGNITSIGTRAFYSCNQIISFEMTGENTTLGESIFGTGTGSYLMGGSTSATKTARVSESNVYLVEALKGMGYEVEEIASSNEKSYAGYPASAIYEIGYHTASDVKAYYNQYSGSLVIAGNGTIKDSAYSTLSDIYATMTSVVIEEGITSIGNSAFKGCKKVVSYELPTTLETIGDSAFYGNTQLTSIDIPDSTTSLVVS